MSWQPPGAAMKYGMGMDAPRSSPIASEMHAIAGPHPADALARPWHHHSPLFWAGVVIATAFGLMAASTHSSVRVGPVRAHAGVTAGQTPE